MICFRVHQAGSVRQGPLHKGETAQNGRLHHQEKIPTNYKHFTQNWTLWLIKVFKDFIDCEIYRILPFSTDCSKPSLKLPL
jgi:hypothetical protein